MLDTAIKKTPKRCKEVGATWPLLLCSLANQDYFRWAQSSQTGDAISITITMPEQIFARRIAPEKANVAIVRIWVVRIEEHNVVSAGRF